MSTAPQEHTQPRISLPDIPILAANAKHAALMTTDGEVKILSHEQAQIQIHKQPVMVCHAPYTRQRLGAQDIYSYDILELFAFVHPAAFCVPTPIGMARALGLSVPETLEDQPFTIMESAQALLRDIQREERPNEINKLKKADPLEIAKSMGQQGKGWAWTPFICSALGHDYNPDMPVMSKIALNIWKHLPEWSEQAPEPPPAHHPVTGEESRSRLSEMLGEEAEARAPQKEYTTQMTAAFAPKQDEDRPHVVLAEAGTGVGKTLGYLAPATVWAEKNDGTAWVSTYTKNLQRQIDQEMDRLYPNPELKNQKVTVRKGRENYLCLLNLEDTVIGAALARDYRQMIAAGLMVRWAEASKDGDLQGGDFPGWLAGLLGFKYTRALADQRGECIYSACDHYHKCFVERTIRKAQHSDIVIANHALIMVKAAVASPEDPLPQRFVFDEGHHLFDAADSAFAGHLTARETHDLRRWIRGAEGGKRTRARGLKRRAEDLVSGNDEAERALEDIIHAATCLPNFGWSRRLKDANPDGPTERFLLMVYKQVHARAEGTNGPYSLETNSLPLIDGLEEDAKKLKDKLRALQKPMRKLSMLFKHRLDEQSDTLDSDTRKRIEACAAGIDRRCDHTLAGWIAMLETLEQKEEAEGFVDWMEVERIDGQAVDIGLYRHWVDPMIPFAKSVQPFAHGLAITSATLQDGTDDPDENWRVARERTGTDYLTDSPTSFAVHSPFDYAERTKIFVVNDVNKNNMDQVAAAYRELFKAAGGGALGLFTAITRLRAVRDRIISPLEESGVHLYAQHVDDMDTGTLVDIFREELHACLLGTDAVRDGVDVPGESLRLLVYDRVPWPRPTILHKARRDAFGGRRYDEMLTRLKLRQAYGRLIRRSTDSGAFVMLDSGLPTRLCGAFPDGVEIQRVGLAEAIAQIKAQS